MIETEEGGERVYRQQVYLRQYQPPTPDPIDIQVQEVMIRPQAQRPPIHVHVGPNRNRDEQRTPSPILIKSAPPQPPPPSSNEPLIYNKYIPVDQKQAPQQVCNSITRQILSFHFSIRSSSIVILKCRRSPVSCCYHHHRIFSNTLPFRSSSKGPIVVEQWLPSKPAPKRVTYRHVNRDEFARTDTERLRNRFIEYSKPHTTIEVEIVRLPVIRIDPQDYQNRSTELTRLDQVRSTTQDPDRLQWRI